jgi:arylsulfatase
MQNGFPPLTMEQQLELLENYGGLDEWGGPHLANHFSVAWAWSTSTPFQWTKQVASHFGGTVSATKQVTSGPQIPKNGTSVLPVNSVLLF